MDEQEYDREEILNEKKKIHVGALVSSLKDRLNLTKEEEQLLQYSLEASWNMLRKDGYIK